MSMNYNNDDIERRTRNALVARNVVKLSRGEIRNISDLVS